MLKKVLTLALAAVMFVSAVSVPVSADDSEQLPVTDSVYSAEYNDLASNFTGEDICDVEVSRGSSFLVTIPKKIVLDGTTGLGRYDVTVDADLAGTEYIEVAPSPMSEGEYASYVLTEKGGKADVQYTVSQDIIYFRANGSVQTDGHSVTDECELLEPAAGIESGLREITFADSTYVVRLKEANRVSGFINASGITAGTWSGAFVFNISMKTK